MSIASPVETSRAAASSAEPRYIRGVPHALPDGEHLLWEGAPSAPLVAKHVFHRAWVIAYFAVMTGWWVVSTMGTVTTNEFLVQLGVRVGLALIVLGVVEFMARAVARTTVYAITSKRVVLKIGVVLPMTINLPLRLLQDAGIARFRDGSGQIALTLLPGDRLAYIALWPHCKVFKLNQPSPVLRGLPNPDEVGALLRDAIVADNDAESVISAAPTPGVQQSGSPVTAH